MSDKKRAIIFDMDEKLSNIKNSILEIRKKKFQ